MNLRRLETYGYWMARRTFPAAGQRAISLVHQICPLAEGRVRGPETRGHNPPGPGVAGVIACPRGGSTSPAEIIDMRANHIPRRERIIRRIRGLELRLAGAWGRFGGGNPYARCKGCDKATPEISISGHGKGCWVRGAEKQLEHYEGLLREAEDEGQVEKPSPCALASGAA